ncbi:MAG: cbb3-type cytochrome c oxidase subunit I [Patescibacteria group bacterium]
MKEKGSRHLRVLLVVCVITSIFVLFSALFRHGSISIYENLPVIPEKVISQESGKVLATSESIIKGQEAFRRLGLMSHMTSMGHGAYLGPDVSADALNRILKNFVGGEAKKFFKNNTYEYDTGELVLPEVYARAWADAKLDYLKEETFMEWGFSDSVIGKIFADSDTVNYLADFFLWQAWISVTPRSADGVSYTNNWPYEPKAGNTITPEAWNATYASIVIFCVILFSVVYLYKKRDFGFGEPKIKIPDLSGISLTASQKSSLLFFILAGVLFLFQVMIGGFSAHYYADHGAFYPVITGNYSDLLVKFFPFHITRALHIQLAILWIASAWMGAGLFVAPLIGGNEPKYQAGLVKILFGAVTFAGLGNIFGIWLSGQQFFSDNMWFWLGTQGWEYFELGRLWQILILMGLAIFSFLVYRGMKPALAKEKDKGSLIHLFLYSVIGITFFYVFGLLFSPTTHITIAEYWRWWVIHLWVEGAFEFFVTVTVAFILVTMNLISPSRAIRTSYWQLILISAGIIGTGHHYYWIGASGSWLMLGSIFSTLEVVPLTLLIGEAIWNRRVIKKAGKNFPFALVFCMMSGVALWNFFGAGVLGAIINVPWTNYYSHGTFLTSTHGHGAMFGVFGLFALTLMVFCLQISGKGKLFLKSIFNLSFAGLMFGLFGMVAILFVIGSYQFMECWNNGYYAARNLAFYDQSHIKMLLWIRIFPDAIFIIFGAAPFVLAIFYNVYKIMIKK